jgi:hypothetical protein
MPPRLGFLNHPTRLELWALQKLMDLETFCHAWMRRETFPRYLFAVSLLPVSALAACTGLLLSRTMALEEANEFCEQRFVILMPKLTSYQEEMWKDNLWTKLIPGLKHITCHHHFPLFESEYFAPPPSLRPQSNPDIMGASGHGVDRAADLALLQSPSAF